MGFVYTKSGSLCCDFCGKAGAKKIACPFGWCQAYAFCKACEMEHAPGGKVYREKHRAAGCEQASARFKREAEERQALLDSGAWVRKAAVGEDGAVKVWFKNEDGGELTAIMAKETYRAIPLITPASLEDYKAIGEVTVKGIA